MLSLSESFLFFSAALAFHKELNAHIVEFLFKTSFLLTYNEWSLECFLRRPFVGFLHWRTSLCSPQGAYSPQQKQRNIRLGMIGRRGARDLGVPFFWPDLTFEDKTQVHKYLTKFDWFVRSYPVSYACFFQFLYKIQAHAFLWVPPNSKRKPAGCLSHPKQDP